MPRRPRRGGVVSLSDVDKIEKEKLAAEISALRAQRKATLRREQSILRQRKVTQRAKEALRSVYPEFSSPSPIRLSPDSSEATLSMSEGDMEEGDSSPLSVRTASPIGRSRTRRRKAGRRRKTRRH